MAKLNMANMNVLFKKGYILAGVIMAANMFAVNEIKASSSNPSINVNQQTLEQQYPPVQNPFGNTNNDNEKNDDNTITVEKSNKKKQGPLDKLLSGENYFNFFGTLALSGANNYFKLWDYNPGWYRQFGCLGWRSKRFLSGVLQFEVNFNLGRGALWSIPHVINLYIIKRSKRKKKYSNSSWVGFFFSDILRGFTSMPLTFHISKFNFSISISLDSIIWWGIIDNILKLSGKKKMEEKKDENAEELNNMQELVDMSEEKKKKR